MQNQQDNWKDGFISRAIEFHACLMDLCKKERLQHRVSNYVSVDLSSEKAAMAEYPLHVEMGVTFHTNVGLQCKLSTYMVDKSIKHAFGLDYDPQQFADLFFRYIVSIHKNSRKISQRRKEIARITREFTVETSLGGIETELLRVEAAPIFIDRELEDGCDPCSLFDVYILGPHNDDGLLTERTYILGTDDPNEFGTHLRQRFLADLAVVKARCMDIAD